jgi:phospho-N-acetylmuramoyl-pentapeptide-transferase
MFYYLIYPLKDLWFGFNVFRYITFRSGMAAVTSFLFCVLVMPAFVKCMKFLKAGQYIRTEHVGEIYDLHKGKQGIPTMGGLVILASVIVSTVLWGRPDNDLVIMSLGGMAWLGMVGIVDDMLKIRNKSSCGLRGRYKLLAQVFLALIVGIFVISSKGLGSELYLPFLKNAVINLGSLYILFILFVIVGTSNAVNLTDGLDGLATGCVIFVALTYSVMCYVAGRADISGYLHLLYIPGAGELTVFCAALAGASLGFLWHNGHPATVFMGDTGSLSLGGAIAIVSVLIKKEILLVLVGGVLVMETMSVIMQVASFRIRGKRIFLMSPLHHHFEKKGWHESKITVRFWIIAAILSLLGLMALKVR